MNHLSEIFPAHPPWIEQNLIESGVEISCHVHLSLDKNCGMCNVNAAA